MNFELTDDEKNLAEQIRGLEIEENSNARDWFDLLGKAGYLTAGVYEEGSPWSLGLFAAQVALAERAPWLVFAAELTRLAGHLIAEHGSDLASDGLLESMVSGLRITAVAFTERSRSTAPDQLGTRAEATGDEWSLTGTKDQVSLARACDWLAVLASIPEGPVVALVEAKAKGVQVGEPIATLGLQDLETCPVTFDGVRVEKQMVLGPFTAERALDLGEELRWAEDRAVTAIALATCRLCVEEAKRAANEPRQAGKPPAGYQAVRFQLAEMLTLTQTAELLAQRAAAETGREAKNLCLCAKVFASEAACRVSDQAMSILASAGYRRDNPVARALIEARFGTMVGHCSNAARMAIADDALARFAQ